MNCPRETDDDRDSAIRLDKWLWAARFFKTRNLAKQAVEAGKVRYNGARCKVSKVVEVGATLTVPCGWDEKEVTVLALSLQRRGAPEAQQLYAETADSVAKREQLADQRKTLHGLLPVVHERPNKKQRRQIHSFKRGALTQAPE